MKGPSMVLIFEQLRLKRFAIVFLILLVLVSCQSKQPFERVEIGKTAPNFTLKDMHGKNVSLLDYKGKVVVLEFWATWCPPCRVSVPELLDLSNKYPDEDFVLVSISVDEGRNAVESVSRFAKENGITYQILLADDQVKRSYGIISVPATFIIDKQQKVVLRHLGYSPGMFEELSKEIDPLL